MLKTLNAQMPLYLAVSTINIPPQAVPAWIVQLQFQESARMHLSAVDIYIQVLPGIVLTALKLKMESA